jgi:hypothetical protein
LLAAAHPGSTSPSVILVGVKWAWLLIRVGLSLALGFLGPHPSIHLWYTPLASGLSRIVKVEILGAQRPDYMNDRYVWLFVQSYLFSCVVAFLFLTFLGWAWRRFGGEPA